MTYQLVLDDDGYLIAYGQYADGDVQIDSIDGYDFSGERMSCHRWDGQKLVFDAERFAAQEAARSVEERLSVLTAQLRATDSIVLEALEGLMAATTATGFIAALVSAARSIKTTLAERADIREQITALRKGGGRDGN